VTEESRLDVRELERLAQERVIEQVYDAINRCDRAAWREPDGLVKVTRRIVLGPTS